MAGPITTSLASAYCGISDVEPTQVLYATGVLGATSYRFNVYDATGTSLIFSYESTQRWFRFSQNSFTYGATYIVKVQVEINSDYGQEGTPCSITLSNLARQIQTPTLNPLHCGSIVNKNDVIYANIIPNQKSYVFAIYDENNELVVELEKPDNFFSIADFNYTEGASYQIAVKTNKENVGYENESSLCRITIAKEVVNTNDSLELKAYPNPFSDSFIIESISDSIEPISYQVFDITGKLLEMNVVKVEELNQFQIGSKYPTGMYLVILKQGQLNKTIKMIKQ